MRSLRPRTAAAPPPRLGSLACFPGAKGRGEAGLWSWCLRFLCAAVDLPVQLWTMVCSCGVQVQVGKAVRRDVAGLC